MLKKKLINILVGLTVFLLVVNLIVENLSKTEQKAAKPVFSVQESENRLFATLNNYGILQEWIKVVKRDYPEQDSLDHYIKVKIPEDLVLPQFIHDFKKAFPDSVNVITEEQEKHGTTLLSVASGDFILLRTLLKYAKNITRPYCSFSFNIVLPEDSKERGIEDLLKNPYPCSVCDVPSFNNLDFRKVLSSNDKELVLILDDNIVDNRFKLSGVTSRQRLKGAVAAIVKNYGAQSYYLIDNNSELVRSSSYDFIKNEFESRGVQLNPMNSLTDFRSKPFDEIHSLIKFYSSSTPSNESVSFLFNYDDYLRLEEFLKQFKKKGHTVTRLSRITALPDSTS